MMPRFTDESTPILVEACCDSLHTARAAQAHGAGRIELCGPGDGGTTPSLGLMSRCRDELQLPIHVMIRCHTHSFVYADDELDIMYNDVVAAKALGIDGVVVGPLYSDGTVQRHQLAELIAAARPMRVVFHRAFDRTSDRESAIDTLVALGIDAVLTSGGAPTALEGAETLETLHRRFGDRITILGGGGVRGHTVRELLARTKLREIHARGTDPMIIRDVVQALTSLQESAPLQTS
ncbi:MAG: copper homeostasis protein CutC [Gemmatimonadaceae bacterium]|nr:copper homeostasis protein CutC [Gemmatimonadaceae bacterium]